MSGEFAGALNERISILAPTGERDPTGLAVTAWKAVCNCRASIKLESVGAQSQGEALSALPRYRFTIRRRDGIALDQRIIWGDRTMTIRQIFDEPNLKDRIGLRCDEVR